MQPLVVAGAFDQPKVDIVACESLFDLLAVARDQGNPHVGEADGEPRQHARKEVLGDGAAGSEPQAAALAVGLEAHFVLQLAVFVGDALGIGEQCASRVGEDEAAAVPLEELGLVAGFQLAYVLAHGRLRDVELLGASREAERLGRSDKNPKPEIVHISPGSRRGRTPRPNARSGRWFAASYRTTCRRAALRWPPPLKYLRAKRFTSTSPRERSEMRMNLRCATNMADILTFLIVRA